MSRTRLPDRRPSMTMHFVYEANTYSVTLGFDVANDRIGEVFTHGAKIGSAMERLLDDACVALSCLRKPVPAFHYQVAAFGGDDVRCARYATFGTPELAEAAVAALQDRTVCLLANHGMIAIGKSLEAAFNNTVKLETLAQGGDPVAIAQQAHFLKSMALSAGAARVAEHCERIETAGKAGDRVGALGHLNRLREPLDEVCGLMKQQLEDRAARKAV